MSVALLMDVHMHGAVTAQLRVRGCDVVAARDQDLHELDDERLLAEATRQNRALVTHDADFLRIAADWQRTGVKFAGVIYGQFAQLPVGKLLSDLEMIALIYDPDDLLNRIEYLPL